MWEIKEERDRTMEFTKFTNERLGESYYSAKHPSGLRILVCPKEGFGSTYAVIGTHFGSINSTFINNGRKITVPDGTAHYLEHKLFESEEGDAFKQYAKTGASANAYTSFDVTCYLFSCTERFEESLGILFDLIRSPYFTPETVAKEQGIIGQEIKMYDDSPEWRSNMNLFQGMYQFHPINKDIAGTVETIAEITPEILYDCYNSYYNLNNMVLCIAGNADPGQVAQVADSKLKENDPVITESIFPEEPYEVGKTYIEQILPVAVPLFSLGFKEAGKDEPVTTKESICTSIILEAFAGEGSELYRELLDKKLINSSFASEYMDGSGYRFISFSGESRDPELAAEIIRKAVRELHEKGISKEDFENARNCTYGRIVRSWDSPSAIATDLLYSEFTGRDVFEASKLISEITADDVNERLKEQLDADNSCLSVIKGIDSAAEDKDV